MNNEDVKGSEVKQQLYQHQLTASKTKPTKRDVKQQLYSNDRRNERDGELVFFHSFTHEINTVSSFVQSTDESSCRKNRVGKTGRVSGPDPTPPNYPDLPQKRQIEIKSIDFSHTVQPASTSRPLTALEDLH